MYGISARTYIVLFSFSIRPVSGFCIQGQVLPVDPAEYQKSRIYSYLVPVRLEMLFNFKPETSCCFSYTKFVLLIMERENKYLRGKRQDGAGGVGIFIVYSGKISTGTVSPCLSCKYRSLLFISIFVVYSQIILHQKKTGDGFVFRCGFCCCIHTSMLGTRPQSKSEPKVSCF